LDGMQTFDQSLYRLFNEGKIGMEDALRNADSRNNLRLRLRLDNAGDIKKNKDGLRLQEDEDFEAIFNRAKSKPPKL